MSDYVRPNPAIEERVEKALRLSRYRKKYSGKNDDKKADANGKRLGALAETIVANWAMLQHIPMLQRYGCEHHGRPDFWLGFPAYFPTGQIVWEAVAPVEVKAWQVKNNGIQFSLEHVKPGQHKVLWERDGYIAVVRFLEWNPEEWQAHGVLHFLRYRELSNESGLLSRSYVNQDGIIQKIMVVDYGRLAIPVGSFNATKVADRDKGCWDIAWTSLRYMHEDPIRQALLHRHRIAQEAAKQAVELERQMERAPRHASPVTKD